MQTPRAVAVDAFKMTSLADLRRAGCDYSWRCDSCTVNTPPMIDAMEDELTDRGLWNVQVADLRDRDGCAVCGTRLRVVIVGHVN